MSAIVKTNTNTPGVNLFNLLGKLVHGTALQRTLEQGAALAQTVASDYQQMSKELPTQLQLAGTNVSVICRIVDLGTLLRGGTLEFTYTRLDKFGQKEPMCVTLQLPQRVHLFQDIGKWDMDTQQYRGLRVELLLEDPEDRYRIVEFHGQDYLQVAVTVGVRQFMTGREFTLEYEDPSSSNENGVGIIVTEVVHTKQPLYMLDRPHIIHNHSLAHRLNLKNTAIVIRVDKGDLAKLAMHF